MTLIIRYWNPHCNMLIFSYLYYCEINNIEFKINFDPAISPNCALIYDDNQTIFFDYSDNYLFIDLPTKYTYYFKRSLKQEDKKDNIYPLNFQVNYSYKAFVFLTRLSFKELIKMDNRIEIIRALDYFNSVTNSSHNAMDIRGFPKGIQDNGGKVLFHTRLWNPDNHRDSDEKERRFLQNEFRISACRVIKKNFKNASVGLFPDMLSAKMAPDLLLDLKMTSKKEYFKSLRYCDIGIADDGLKDTPGWKIGEYLLFGKAVVTTPLNISLNNFKEGKNYQVLSTRSAYFELPEKINYLLKEKKYLEMCGDNFKWSDDFLHPKNYINNILSNTKLIS
nr:hypothetical protein [uncultured Flavobacterium sp.]